MSQFLLRFLECGQNQHSLASTQSVGLEHIGRLQRFQERQTFFQCLGCKGLIGSCRDLVAHHEVLGKVLGTFELCASLGRTDDGDGPQLLVGQEEIGNATHQWVFRSHDNHINLIFQHKLSDTTEVVNFQWDVDAHLTGSCIARSNVQRLCLGRLSNFPCEGVLTAATT